MLYGRQQQAYGRALAGFGPDFEAALMSLYDAVDDGQTQAGALEFGRA